MWQGRGTWDWHMGWSIGQEWYATRLAHKESSHGPNFCSCNKVLYTYILPMSLFISTFCSRRKVLIKKDRDSTCLAQFLKHFLNPFSYLFWLISARKTAHGWWWTAKQDASPKCQKRWGMNLHLGLLRSKQ